MSSDLTPKEKEEPATLGEVLSSVIGGLFVIYLFISGLALLNGLVSPFGCTRKETNGSYLFPAYKVGCWLGEEKK